MNELLTLTDHFRIFLSERPAISPERLAVELGIDPANLHKIIHHQREIPKHRRGDFPALRDRFANDAAVWVLEFGTTPVLAAAANATNKTSLLSGCFPVFQVPKVRFH